MASINPAKKNTALAFELDVFDYSGKFLTAATFSAAQISKDGGAFVALTNAPVEIGASGVYTISLTAAEMNADRVKFRFVIASAPDIGGNIETVSRQFNDLAYPATSGRSTDVDASGRVLLQPAQPGVTIPTVSTTTTLTNDPGGVTTLLTLLTTARAGYLDLLNTYLNSSVAAVKAVVDLIQSKTDLLPTDPADESSLQAALASARAAILADTVTIKGKTNLLPASPAAVGSQMDLVNAPNATAITALQAGLATAANLTLVLNRLGAITGTGVNTLLGYVRALVSKTVSLPSDLTSGGLTYDNTTDALEAVRDRGDAAWTGGGSTPSAASIADAVWDEVRADHVAAGSFGQGAASVQGNVTGSVGSVVGAVGSVTGNIGGNIGGTVPDSAGVTTLLSRLTSTRAGFLDHLAALAGFGGTLVNMLRALARKNVTSVDLAATYDPATDSLEALREKIDTVAAVAPVTQNFDITEA